MRVFARPGSARARADLACVTRSSCRASRDVGVAEKFERSGEGGGPRQEMGRGSVASLPLVRWTTEGTGR